MKTECYLVLQGRIGPTSTNGEAKDCTLLVRELPCTLGRKQAAAGHLLVDASDNNLSREHISVQVSKGLCMSMCVCECVYTITKPQTNNDLSIYLPVSLSIYIYICLSVHLLHTYNIHYILYTIYSLLISTTRFLSGSSLLACLKILCWSMGE